MFRNCFEVILDKLFCTRVPVPLPKSPHLEGPRLHRGGGEKDGGDEQGGGGRGGKGRFTLLGRLPLQCRFPVGPQRAGRPPVQPLRPERGRPVLPQGGLCKKKFVALILRDLAEARLELRVFQD